MLLYQYTNDVAGARLVRATLAFRVLSVADRREEVVQLGHRQRLLPRRLKSVSRTSSFARR
jgi:hypothetical protein